MKPYGLNDISDAHKDERRVVMDQISFVESLLHVAIVAILKAIYVLEADELTRMIRPVGDSLLEGLDARDSVNLDVYGIISADK
jgi:hypothetical protein